MGTDPFSALLSGTVAFRVEDGQLKPQDGITGGGLQESESRRHLRI